MPGARRRKVRRGTRRHDAAEYDPRALLAGMVRSLWKDPPADEGPPGEVARIRSEVQAVLRRSGRAGPGEDAARTAHLEEIARIHREVQARSGADLIDLHDEQGGVVARVPRAPFLCWALRHTALQHLAPPWVPVAGSGMKAQSDDPFHSDWYYGAGLGLDGRCGYGTPVARAAEREMLDLLARLGSFSCAVLVPGEVLSGVAGQDIAVVPDLSPDRLVEVAHARAIVTEAGGAGAHLAQIALERGAVVVLVAEACRKFPPGTPLYIDPGHGRVEVEPGMLPALPG